MENTSKRTSRALILLVGVSIILLACPTLYTIGVLALARGEGVYVTPQDGAAGLAQRYFPEYPEVQISRAGPTQNDPTQAHVWYVTWRACRPPAANDFLLARMDCKGGGSYFLHGRDGWVTVREIYVPEYVGFWMKFLRLDGNAPPGVVLPQGWALAALLLGGVVSIVAHTSRRVMKGR